MKKIIALLLAVMMVLAMAACAAKTTDTPAPAETDNKTDAVQETATEAAADGKTELNIGVLVWKYSDTYGSSVRVAMDKYAKEIGAEKGLTINLEMQDGNDDQATQNNQADVMFAAGKDHIIINLCDTSAGQYLVDLAKQYNVPISFYNKEPVDSSIVTGSNSIFVGTKPEEAGIMQGEILADLYAANPERVDKNGDGKVMTLEFEGEINNPEAIARTEYSLSTAIERGVPCEMMTENQVANWDTAKAQEMMTAQIASLGVENIEVVFCNNDDMAIGVIAALNEVGPAITAATAAMRPSPTVLAATILLLNTSTPASSTVLSSRTATQWARPTSSWRSTALWARIGSTAPTMSWLTTASPSVSRTQRSLRNNLFRSFC